MPEKALPLKPDCNKYKEAMNIISNNTKLLLIGFDGLDYEFYKQFNDLFRVAVCTK